MTKEWKEVPRPIPFRIAKDLFIRSQILNALAYTDGNYSKAAELLGLQRSHFYKYCHLVGIPLAGYAIHKSKEQRLQKPKRETLHKEAS